MMTSTIRKFGVGVASIALVASMAGPAFAANEPPKPLDGGWDRVASDKPVNDRIDTAIAVANYAYSTNKAAAKSVYIVNYMANIDAATAGQLTDGPILLVKDDSRTLDQVAATVKEFTSAKTVYAVGGTAVVSDAMLKAVAGSKATGRIAGEDRYDTAVKVAERVAELSPEKGKRLYLSRGDLAIDALTAGSLDDGPVLLVKNGTLTENTKKYIEAKKPTKVVGLGGKTYVPDSVLSEAQLPGVIENPAANYDEEQALLKAFRYNRMMYLGFNRYVHDKSVVLDSSVDAGTSSDPRDIADKKDLADSAANRWMGYKDQLEEVQTRMDEVIVPAISRLQSAANNELTDAKQSAAANVSGDKVNGKVRLKDFAPEAAAGKVAQAAKALYGVELSGDAAKDKQFYVLVPDSKHEGDDSMAFVDRINWSKFEDQNVYKTAAKAANDMLKAYKTDFGRDESKLYNGGNAAANASNKLATVRDLQIVPTLEYTSLNSEGQYLMVTKNTLAGLISIATNNASTTKTAMEDALSKISSGTSYFRLWGEDRYQTAAQISAYRRADLGKDAVTKGGSLSKVYIANGITMVDALVAGVLEQGPILLADANGNLPEATIKELNGIGKTNVNYTSNVPFVELIGGKTALPDRTGSAAAAALKAGYAGKPEKRASDINAAENTALLQSMTGLSETAPSFKKIIQVKDGRSNLVDPNKTKLVSATVYGPNGTLPATIKANGEIEITVDVKTAKTGTYTVLYNLKGDSTDYKTKFTYGTGTPVEVSDTDYAAGNAVKYAVGTDYNGAKVYDLANPAAALSNVTVASGDLTATSGHEANITSKTLLLIKDNVTPAKVITTGANIQQLATPTFSGAAGSLANNTPDVEQKLVKIEDFGTKYTDKGVTGVNGNYLPAFTVEVVNNDLTSTDKVTITKIDADGNIWGKIANGESTKKFKVKVTAKAAGDYKASEASANSADITIS